MNIVTIGSKIVDDAVIKSNGRLNNLERIVEISPLSFSEPIKVLSDESEKRNFLNKLKVTNEYMRYLFGLDFFKEVFNKIKGCNLDFITFDFTAIRLLIHEFVFSDGFKYRLTENLTLKDNIVVIREFLGKKYGKIISERIINPINMDNEILKTEIRRFLSTLFSCVNKGKIVYLKVSNVNQYISRENTIEILPNQNVINSTNAFYRRCENIATSMINDVITIEFPEYAIGDEHVMPPNMFNYNKNYYEYLIESLLAIKSGSYAGSKSDIKTKYEVKQKIEIEDISMIPLLQQASIKSKGRKIIVVGNSESFSYILRKKYGLSVYKSIESTVSKDLTILEKELNIIRDKNSEFFCVVPYLYSNVDILSTLWKYGYGFATGYVCMSHKPYILKDFVGHYTDIFDNEINSKFPCTIEIRGCANKIELNGGGGKNIRIIALNNTQICIEENVSIADNFSIRIYDSATVRISKGTKIGKDSHIRGNFFTKTEIGENCYIGDRAILFNGDGHAIIDLNSGNNINYSYKNSDLRKHQISIGEHVYIGDDVFVLSGTCVGKNSIIHENSLLNKVFGENKYIGGHPAVAMEENVTWRN